METVIWVSDTDNKPQVHTGSEEAYFKTGADVILNFTVRDETILQWITAVAGQIDSTHAHYTSAITMTHLMEDDIRKESCEQTTTTYANLLRSAFDRTYDVKRISVLNAILEELCNMYLKIRSNIKPIEG